MTDQETVLGAVLDFSSLADKLTVKKSKFHVGMNSGINF